MRAFLLAPPPWDSQVDLATCFLYTPLCSVLKSANMPAIKLLFLLFSSSSSSCYSCSLSLSLGLARASSYSTPAKIDAAWAPLVSEDLPDALCTERNIVLLTGVSRISRSRDVYITATDRVLNRL